MTASGSPDNELEITLDSPTREITVSGPPGSVGVPHLRKKMMSLCSCLRRSWFMKEVFMLLKLVLPLVSHLHASYGTISIITMIIILCSFC